MWIPVLYAVHKIDRCVSSPKDMPKDLTVLSYSCTATLVQCMRSTVDVLSCCLAQRPWLASTAGRHPGRAELSCWSPASALHSALHGLPLSTGTCAQYNASEHSPSAIGVRRYSLQLRALHCNPRCNCRFLNARVREVLSTTFHAEIR